MVRGTHSLSNVCIILLEYDVEFKLKTLLVWLVIHQTIVVAFDDNLLLILNFRYRVGTHQINVV